MTPDYVLNVGEPTPEEVEAIRVLAKRGRLLVVVVPKGVPSWRVEALSRRVNAELDLLASGDHEEPS